MPVDDKTKSMRDSTQAANGGTIEASIDASLLVPETVDGITQPIAAIALTEQVLADKEANLRRAIKDNYAKIAAVEKELEALHLEVKLTSGSKKAGMELLRRKIEQATDKVKAAKLKEDAAKKLWESASKALEEEEAKKQKLCDDLRLMVEENALAQYQRLEALTHKLDALSPEMAGVAKEAIEGLRAKIAPHGAPSYAITSGSEPQAGDKRGDSLTLAVPPPEGSNAASNDSVDTPPGRPSDWASSREKAAGSAERGDTNTSQIDSQQEGGTKAKPAITGRLQSGRGRGRGRGKLVGGAGSYGQTPKNNDAWTGAGFDVDDESYL